MVPVSIQAMAAGFILGLSKGFLVILLSDFGTEHRIAFVGSTASDAGGSFDINTVDNTHSPFQGSNAGGDDAIIGRIPLSADGGASAGDGDEWIASFFGGTGDDLANALSSFAEGVFIYGTTASSNNSLSTMNLAAGTFFKSTHQGARGIFSLPR